MWFNKNNELITISYIRYSIFTKTKHPPAKFPIWKQPRLISQPNTPKSSGPRLRTAHYNNPVVSHGRSITTRCDGTKASRLFVDTYRFGSLSIQRLCWIPTEACSSSGSGFHWIIPKSYRQIRKSRLAYRRCESCSRIQRALRDVVNGNRTRCHNGRLRLRLLYLPRMEWNRVRSTWKRFSKRLIIVESIYDLEKMH